MKCTQMKTGIDSSDFILIVATKSENQQGLVKILEKENYRIKIVESYKQALEISKTSPPRLIIFDIYGFESDDYVLFNALRRKKNTKELPVIVIGTSSLASDKAKAFEMGAKDYITNPFLAVEIIARIKTQIKLYKSQKYLNERIRYRTFQLEKNNEKYENLINNTSTIIYRYEFTPKKGFNFISPSVYQITGYSPQECYNDADLFVKIVHPEDKHLIETHFSNPEKTNESLILRWYKKDQTIIWTEQRDTPIYNKNGELIAFEGIVRDITKQKKAEDQLKENETKLRETQQMAQLGYWDWDIKTGNVEWSEEVYKIFQLNPEEFVPQIDSILALSPWPEDHERDKELIQKAIESREIGSYEQRFLRPDGGTGYYQSTFQGIYDNNEELTAMQGTVQDITTRKLAENALRESEIKYRSLVESLEYEYFFYRHDTDGVFSYVSPSITNILGYSVNEFLKHFSEYMTDSPLNDNVRYYTEQSIKGIEQGIYEIEILNKNGNPHTLEVKEVPILGKDGNVIAVEGIAHDITDKKRSQEKLKSSEEQYRILFENMNEGFALHDMIFDDNGKPYDYRYLDINPTFTRLTGLQQEVALGKTIRELTPEIVDDPADWINKFGNVVITGEEFVIDDYSVALKKWFRVHAFKAKENQFAVTVSDVTEKKRAEENINQLNENLEKRVIERTLELQNINELLRKERDKAQMYLDIADVIILTLDQDRNVTMINKKGCEVFGYEESEMIGKNWYEHFRDKTGKEEGLREFKRIVHKNNKEVIPNENYIVTKNGQKRLIAWSDINIQDSEGNPIGMLSSGEDITERKALEEGLIKAEIVANEANRAKSEFLANMSHEIRTPMNAILGFTELLSNQVTDELPQNYLESIKSSGQSLLTIINDILDFSKIEAGKMELEYRHVNLYTIFQEMSAIFSLKVIDKGLEFIMDIEPVVPSIVYIDEIRLRQVILNLLSNAVKFTEKGHVKLFATSNNLTIHNDNKYCDLIIKIEDTGIGIPKESQEKIFNSFTQQEGQSIKKYGGTGLGLAISKTLTKLMNGGIQLESKVGLGSTFKILLNNVKIAEAIPESEAIASIDPKSIEFKGSKVLVVDDIEDNMNYIAIALGNYNLHLLQASNGREALNLIEYDPPDLVITDLWMPGLDGMEMQERLQKNPSLKKIPVVATSASAMKDTLKMVKERKFSGFLRKPFRIGELISEMIKHVPYKIVNNKSIKKNQAEKISKLKIENVDAFLKALNRLNKIHKPLMSRQPIKDVKNFADNCISVAKEFNILILTEYGKSLQSAANSFDIDALLKRINSYQQLINKIKKHVTDK